NADAAVRADLEVQLEESAGTAAEPWRQEEIQLANIGALVLGKLGVVVADAHVCKTVHRHAEILGVLPGTRGHLCYRLLDSRQALRSVWRGCCGHARLGCDGRTGRGCSG